MVVLEFDTHHDEIWLYLQKSNNNKKRDQLLRAPSSVGRYNSTRVDEGRKCWLLLAIKMKARAEVGREEEGLVCDPGSELMLGGSARVVLG